MRWLGGGGSRKMAFKESFVEAKVIRGSTIFWQEIQEERCVASLVKREEIGPFALKKCISFSLDCGE